MITELYNSPNIEFTEIITEPIIDEVPILVLDEQKFLIDIIAIANK